MAQLFIQRVMRDRDRSSVEGHLSARRDSWSKLFTSVPMMLSSMLSISHNLFHEMSNTSLCRGVLNPQNHSWTRHACCSAFAMHVSRNVIGYHHCSCSCCDLGLFHIHHIYHIMRFVLLLRMESKAREIKASTQSGSLKKIDQKSQA